MEVGHSPSLLGQTVAKPLTEIELATRRLAEIAKDDGERELHRHLAIIAAGRRWR